MSGRSDWAGAEERATARALIGSIPGTSRAGLQWRGINLAPAAEHALYTALRRRGHPTARDSRTRGIARIASGVMRVAGDQFRRARPRGDVVLILVTQPVHLELARPVVDRLRSSGIHALVVDAETRHRRRVLAPDVDRCLLRELSPADVPSLVARELAMWASVPRIRAEWAARDAAHHEELIHVLTRGAALAALDCARLDRLAAGTDAKVIACFSESGMLSRVAPAVGHRRGTPVVDLPHAEANDPFGSAGAAYDAMLVYGPRARAALEAGGIPSDRIMEVGPLRHDGLIARGVVEPDAEPRRVVFASQPTNEATPALRPAVQREAFEAALAVAGSMAPSELVVVPHPTESPHQALKVGRERVAASGIRTRVVEPGDLHRALEGAWVLVTGSSQSVFEAVLTGVPAVTVTPAGLPEPVSFSRDGIAVGIRSAAEAATLGAELSDRPRRDALAATQRLALGDRLGPLDGRAAERVADVLERLVHGAR